MAVRATFGVPDDHEPIGAIAIGQPAPGGSTGSAWRGRRTPWIGSSTEAAGEPGSGWSAGDRVDGPRASVDPSADTGRP